MSKQPKEVIQTVGGEPLDSPDYFSWENFCQYFNSIGYIKYFDGGILVPPRISKDDQEHEVCLELGKAYRIKNITIKNGLAEVEICNFPSRFEGDVAKQTVMTFGLGYEVTQLNFQNIAKHLYGDNFRVEIASRIMANSKWALGKKYAIQLGREQLAFRQGTM